MKLLKSSICLLLVLFLLIGNLSVSAEENDVIRNILYDTADYILNTVTNPQVSSIGGEWAILGLARSGYDVPSDYYQNYYRNVEEYVKSCNGNLHDKKYTEYSRLVVALTAIGKNPSDVAGYNLLMPLGDYEKTVWQGINGPVWALIALDSKNYDIPKNPEANIQASREMYINYILENQLSDGGWSLSGKVSDVDITGMALQALAKYQNDEKVKAAIERALECMSVKQDENGGFSSWNTKNSESCVQMTVALCELGISIYDNRFLKNQNSILDNLLTYYEEKNGFRHTTDGGGSDLMATEQALYCLAAVNRALNNQNSLYRMDDAITISETVLEDSNTDVRKTQVVFLGKTFSDISGHINQQAVEALASRNIINGKTENLFEPDSTMTRAEFAAIIVRGLGLLEKTDTYFSDVTQNDWFYSYVSTAYFYGIVKGVSETSFNPNGTITREEAAVMLTRATKLCGMNTQIETFEARNILAGFFDYVKASDWAFDSLAFLVRENIISNDLLELKPKEAVKRAEIAQMLYNLLYQAELL